MDVTIIFSIISVLGGLGLFLIGMKQMGEGLELAAGNKLRVMLQKITSNKFIAMLVGVLVTGVIQSSSATDAMVVGFVNAGLMDLNQCIGILFGSKIGTTVTSLILSFDIKAYVPLCTFAGAVIITFAKKNNYRYYGQILAGFGILFMGMSMMSANFGFLKNSEMFKDIVSSMSSPVLGLLVGMVFTGIIQSSSASVGILMSLAAAGLVSLDNCIYIIFGMNVGACVPVFLSSAGANRESKQVALSNFLISLFAAILISVLVMVLSPTAFAVPSLLNGIPFLRGNVPAQISAVHILFNVLLTIVFLPLSGAIIKLTKLILPDVDEEKEKMETVYLDTRILTTPPMAVLSVENECKRLGELARKNYTYAMQAFFEGDARLIEKVEKNEKVIDFLTHEITRYIVKINGLDIVDSDRKTMGVMYSAIQDMERIGDHAENIVEHAKEMMANKVKFSDDAIQELHDLDGMVAKLLDEGLTLFNEQNVDFDIAKSVIETESSLDSHVKIYKFNHINRMNSGICSAENGTIFLDMLTILERVGDHANNVAFSIPRNKLGSIVKRG
ncbi:MAG: Na/Pi cotransporter family protein [Ruminococcus sp.]|jgi:phosphate:Na+ symporter|nr:Na/Pi cotransporter family protein [Ruminococcus sp.]MBQ1380823.1 Na/Pi cotransporter family protein [Ruminococcus sp.]MBQ1601310.1 Na/Pi cotransporter family protein [Ruminococcus sp.]MBQ1638958.1 Na/Pi cotransporter family protein [Ruminococcus sp.]MBQ1686818.1 Na/Pi cotransporter family protein [Ruminococcus sp.]